MEFISRVAWLMWFTMPVWFPVITGYLAWMLWLQYVRKKFDAGNNKILLEVKMPLEVFKSPKAMELVLTALHITSRESTWIDRYVKGQSRPMFSLELVSLSGQVRFFIRTEETYKNLIESQIYAQYPGVEIYDAPDYTRGIKFDPAQNQLWGVEFIKSKPDPLPIKTYVDYGMDKDPDEEVKIDPMTPMLEFLGIVPQGHQVWFQIMIKAHKNERKVKDKKGKTIKVDWMHTANEEKQKILDRTKGDGPDAPRRRLTRGEEDIITAIDRNTSKLPFDTGIRAIYIAPKDIYNRAFVTGVNGITRQYNANNLNGFKLDRGTSFDYPWQDFRGQRLRMKKSSMLRAYKRRAFFKLFGRKPYVMSTEELATIYHFPGSVASTPTFARIMSKKSEPPANLPL